MVLAEAGLLGAVALLVVLLAVTTGRSRAETIPVVTVEDRPSGLPIAMTPCPVASLEESPIRATVRSLGACSIWTTAKSVALSVPVREAG